MAEDNNTPTDQSDNSQQPVNAGDGLQTENQPTTNNVNNTGSTAPIVELEPDPDPDPEPEKTHKRFTKTAVFSPDEFAYVDKVFDARYKSRLSNDFSHFLRQCVDFAINCKHVPGSTFATPDIPKYFLKNAFFNSTIN